MARIVINWRFLLTTSFSFLVILVAMFLVHRFQVRKQVDAYLRQADAAAATQPPDVEREIKYLQRYLAARPSEIDTRERLAHLLLKSAQYRKEVENLYFMIEDVLRRAPERDSLRRLAYEIAIDRLKLYPEAKGHLEYLLKKSPKDAELEERMAFCLFAERKHQDAIKWYQQAYTHKPDLLDAYKMHQAILWEQLKETKKAREIVKDMLAKNPKSVRAWLQAADFWQRQDKQPTELDNAVATSKQLAPDDIDVILLVADVARERALAANRKGEKTESEEKWEEVRTELNRGLKLHPKQPSLYLAKARLESETRSPKDAAEVIKTAISVTAESIPLVEALVDYQIQAGAATGAEASLAKLEKLGVKPERLAFSRAQLLVLREQWLAAIAALEKVRLESAVDNPVVARSASLQLGRCYEQIGENDRRLEAYTRAIPDDSVEPVWIIGMVGRADALAALGRRDDALLEYQKIADLAPGAWLNVARFLMLKTLSEPDPKKADWAPVERALGRAEKALPDSIEPQLLRADLLALRGKLEDSRKIVEDLFAKKPKEPAVWVAKAAQQFREKDVTAAISTLEKGRYELSDPLALRLAEARYFADPKDPNTANKLGSLATGVDKYSSSERRRLFQALAEAATAAGLGEVAASYWDQVLTVQKDYLAAHLVRFDRALRANDEPGIQAVLSEISRVEGAKGTNTRATRALYLIWKSQQKKDPSGLAEALELLNSIESNRPGWSRIPLGRALIYDLQGNAEQALTQYQAVVGLGYYDPQVLRRLTELLAAKGLFEEANKVLEKLPNLESSGPDAQRLAAEVSLKVDNPKRALELAAKAVSADSKNVADLLWLARVMFSGGNRTAAEKPFRRAVELKPEDPAPLTGLVSYLVQMQRIPDAKEVIAKAKSSIRAEDRLLTLAQCYAMVGMLTETEEAIKNALRERPDDPKAQFAEADYLTSRGKLQEAREAWTRLISMSKVSDDDKQFATRMLAICMSVDQDYATTRRAMAVLGMDGNGALIAPKAETPKERRTRAMILALQKDRASKLEAIRLLNIDGDNLPASDRFMLAQVYGQVGDLPAVRLTMTQLMNKDGRNPMYLAAFADWLLNQGDIREAEGLVKKLEAMPAQKDTFRTLVLKVRVLGGKKESAAAKALLIAEAEKAPAETGQLARLAEEVGLHSEAECLFKKFVELNIKKQPEVVFSLAKFYARRNQLDEALKTCESGWAKCPPTLAGQQSVEVLALAPTRDPKQLARVEEWLADALKKPNADVALRLQLAYLKSIRGDHDGSAQIYEQLSSGTKADPLVLNNLGYLLSAHKGRHEEAIKLIERAKQAVGPVPSLLDTEALILTARGKPEDLTAARALLKDVIALAPSGSAYFHLSQLEDRAGNRLERDVAWIEATKLKLEMTDLHPLEWPAWKKMKDGQK